MHGPRVREGEQGRPGRPGSPGGPTPARASSWDTGLGMSGRTRSSLGKQEGTGEVNIEVRGSTVSDMVSRSDFRYRVTLHSAEHARVQIMSCFRASLTKFLLGCSRHVFEQTIIRCGTASLSCAPRCRDMSANLPSERLGCEIPSRNRYSALKTRSLRESSC